MPVDPEISVSAELAYQLLICGEHHSGSEFVSVHSSSRNILGILQLGLPYGADCAVVWKQIRLQPIRQIKFSLRKSLAQGWLVCFRCFPKFYPAKSNVGGASWQVYAQLIHTVDIENNFPRGMPSLDDFVENPFPVGLDGYYHIVVK